MIVVVFLLGWLALSVVVTVAYAVGASAGYRRGFGDASAQTLPSPDRGHPLSSPARPVEVRLPEDVRHAP